MIPLIGVGLVVVLVIGGVFMTKSGKSGGSTISANKSIFPLPSSVENFTKAADEAVNFQTTLPIKQAEEFYRAELTKMNLKERTINTSVTDTTFSMVFDGYSNGKAIVVQGVDIAGKTNINIRFEKI